MIPIYWMTVIQFFWTHSLNFNIYDLTHHCSGWDRFLKFKPRSHLLTANWLGQAEVRQVLSFRPFSTFYNVSLSFLRNISRNYITFTFFLQSDYLSIVVRIYWYRFLFLLYWLVANVADERTIGTWIKTVISDVFFFFIFSFDVISIALIFTCLSTLYFFTAFFFHNVMYIWLSDLGLVLFSRVFRSYFYFYF